jgi:hypothetical protein
MPQETLFATIGLRGLELLAYETPDWNTSAARFFLQPFEELVCKTDC